MARLEDDLTESLLDEELDRPRRRRQAAFAPQPDVGEAPQLPTVLARRSVRDFAPQPGEPEREPGFPRGYDLPRPVPAPATQPPEVSVPGGVDWEKIYARLDPQSRGGIVPAPAQAPAPAPAQAGMPADWQAWFRQISQGVPVTPAGLASLEQQLATRGVRLQKDSAGQARGRMFLPTGETVDVSPTGWQGDWQWISRGAGGGGAEAAGAAGAGLSVGPAPSITTVGAEAKSSLWNPLLQALMARLKGRADPTLESPNVRAQFNPMAERLQRSAERQRSQLAERARFEGTPSGAFQADVQGIEEARGRGEAEALGGIIGGELQQERQEIMQALSIGAGLLTSAEQQSLQERLAYLNAQVQREGLGLGREQLGFQRESFYDQLGADIGWREAQLNQALMELLSRGQG